jgi:hypothetical protein
MKAKPPRFSLIALAAVCAYGLGWLVGQRVNALVHPQPPSSATQEVVLPGADTGVREPPEPERTPVHAMPSAFLPAGVSAGQILTAKLAELDQSGKDHHAVLIDQITPLLLSLKPDAYPLLWSQTLALKSPGLRKDVLSALVYAWAGRDPAGALNAAQRLAPGAAREQAVETILWRWAGTNPAAAWTWAREQPAGQPLESAFQNVIGGMAQTDALGALARLSELPPEMDARFAVRRVIAGLAAEHPEAAAALLAKAGFSGETENVYSIAAGYVSQGMDRALNWATNLPSAEARHTALDGLVCALVKTEPAQALQLASRESDAALRKRLLPALAEAWSRTDLEAATTWLGQIPDESERRRAAEAVLREWTSREPGRAGQLALDLFPPGEARNRSLADIGRHWLTFSQDDEAARRWADLLSPGAERDAFLAGLCGRLQATAPEQAARVVADMSAGRPQVEAARTLAWYWVRFEAEPAAAWAANLPNGLARLQSLPVVAEYWAGQDAGAASDWLRALPADGALAEAIEAFVAQASPPQAAAVWVERIGNEEKRYQAIEKIARQWLSQDTEAARTWLQQTSLPAERKERLLNRNP